MARRLALSEVVHKLIGARSTTNIIADHPRRPDTTNYRHTFDDDSFLTNIAKQNRLVYLGEIHSKPSIVALQYELQQALAKQSTKLHVVLEHFSFEMQPLLDQFCAGDLSFEELVNQYHQQGSEGHNLWPYRHVLEHARDDHSITVHAGFLPRRYARTLMKEGPQVAFNAASIYLPAIPCVQGTDFHYNIFEGLISGRSITSTPPTDQVRRIFPAQVLKDVAMGHKVQTLLDTLQDGEKLLVVAGNGHFLHYCGVPERVKFPSNQTALIVSMSAEGNINNKDVAYQNMDDMYGREGTYPADYVYMYSEPIDVKKETRDAYDRVGSSAHLQGNAAKARAIMSALGYTAKQFEQAGPDAHNFQGVGNPHRHAKIKTGDKVLDVGSGLGIDSFIASFAAGDKGRVVGIDLSSKEVQHAQKRANERDLNVQFSVADMENLPFPNESFDVIVSNGAFCLAPNKEQAFRELYRVLKPGGRISVCTTTTKEDLAGNAEWPLCMRMFIPLKDIEPALGTIGFSDVYIDDSDSSMTMELPVEVKEGSNPDRNRVHVGGPEFSHLEKYDMDKLCARVCVVATKPKAHNDA